MGPRVRGGDIDFLRVAFDIKGGGEDVCYFVETERPKRGSNSIAYSPPNSSTRRGEEC